LIISALKETSKDISKQFYYLNIIPETELVSG
jgi:hypothetical protein